MSAPVEILVSELQCRILVEVYLAHGPVDIFRLWSEMFERQKSISVGMLLFTRAIVQLEDEGYLQKVAEMSSTLAPKGEMYLIGAVLSGELPEGCWEKISTTNILDVAPPGQKEDTNGKQAHQNIATLRTTTRPSEGICSEGKLQDSRLHTPQANVGCSQQGMDTPTFQGVTIERLVDAVFRAEERAEQSRLEEIEADREGGDTAASGYPEPASDRSFA